MTGKLSRLRELPRHTERTPQTHWDYDSFAAAAAASNSRWWVRSLAERPGERYHHPQHPLTADQVGAFFAGLDERVRASGRFVIQQYIEPAVAGATLCTVDGTLSEAVAGAAEPLLRGGAAGEMLASHGGRVSWRTDRGVLDDTEALSRAHATIPTEPGTLWEWIVDSAGETFHVDHKSPGVALLVRIPHDAPPDVWQLGLGVGGTRIQLPDTSIAWLSRIVDPCVLEIAQGSPLAHLCYEAVVRGSAVVLTVD